MNKQANEKTTIEALLFKATHSIQAANLEDTKELLLNAHSITSDPYLKTKICLVEIELLLSNNLIPQAKSKIEEVKEYHLTKKELNRFHILKAEYHLRYGDTENAIKPLQQASKESYRLSSKDQLKLQYLSALLLKKLGKYDKAKAKYDNIFIDLEREELHTYLADTYIDKANISLVNADYNAALDCLQKAENIANQNNISTALINIYELKAKIFYKTGENQLAMDAMKMQIHHSKVQQIRVAEITASIFKPFEKIKEHEDLKRELAIANKNIDNQDYSYVMLFALMTLLALLAMSFYTNNRLRAKNNRELEKKNRSLTIERDRAQNAARIKSDFLSTITHELRTPMYAVTGLTHLLLENKPRPDQKEHLETLKSSGEYLLSLINNILDFNKLEAKKAEIEVIPFNLKKRLEGIVKSLKQQAIKQGNQLHLEFESNLPEMVKGDPIKLSQIVINLLSNAIKFTKNGHIYVRSKVIDVKDGSKLIQFEIEDNGKGISLEKQESIFDFFSQEDSSTTRKYGGSGLGLAIVSNLIELMGGHIELDSELGRGSNFKFSLWLQSTDEKSNESIKSKARVKPVERIKKTKINVKNTSIINANALPLKDLTDKRILIVEDNRINQLITRKILEGKNFSCDVASDGEEAIQKYRDGNFDLILMDIHMPVMDGKQATTIIRKENKDIPILALTAVTVAEAEQELYELGFDDIIPKPFKVDLFFEKIQQAFTRYEIL